VEYIDKNKDTIAVLGAGITGLTAACLLQQKGKSPLVIERDKSTGGLAKTIDFNGFKFDLGGHRFLTKNYKLESFVKTLLNRRFVVVPRSSTIYLNHNYIKYPLDPLDTFNKVGYLKSFQFIYDYFIQKFHSNHNQNYSLEDWVVNRFGTSLYKAFFKDYSEKVWGLGCAQIDSDWISQRIQNLNLGAAIMSAVLKSKRIKYATLTDKFLYPTDGIGSITENLKQTIPSDKFLLDTKIERIEHNDRKIKSINIHQNNKQHNLEVQRVLSTIPLNAIVRLLDPPPPDNVTKAARQLRSRDLILVTIALNRPLVTRNSWIYFPEKSIPFGRIHEPKNWSSTMSPRSKTSLVTEHFCFNDDNIWQSTDTQIIEQSIKCLCKLNIINKNDVIDALVVKVRNAYPLFEIGYRENSEIVSHYLSQFSNLTLAGRTGKFRYYNMDQAMLSAVEAVESISQSRVNLNPDFETNIINVRNGEPDEMRAYHTSLVT